MISANIAASSHLKRRRDSDSDSSGDLEEIERKYPSENGNAEGQDNLDCLTQEERAAREEEARRIRQLIIEHRRKKCLKDYKTWGYLVCVAVIVIGAIVLIVLAGAGVISTDSS